MDYNAKDMIDRVFNNGGYILDFTSENFSRFTIDSIGVNILSEYKKSKGKSLLCFLDDDKKYNDDIKYKLIKDLINYYEKNSDNINCSMDLDQLNKLKEIIYNHDSIIWNDSFTNSDYMEKQIERMNNALKTSSSYECIGIAKEYVETCCKDILKSYNVSPNHCFIPLINQTLKVLGINRKEKTINEIVQGLSQALQAIANLRNENGSGHGRVTEHIDIEVRYAKLAINCATTIIYFFNDTYKVNNK